MAALIIIGLAFGFWMMISAIIGDARDAKIQASLSRFGGVAERASATKGYEGVCEEIEARNSFKDITKEGDLAFAMAECHDSQGGWCVQAFLSDGTVMCVDRSDVHKGRECNKETTRCQ